MSKLIECKVCFKEIALGAKSCPNCGAKKDNSTIEEDILAAKKKSLGE